LAEDVLFDMKQIARKKFDWSKVDLLMNELYPGKNMDVPDPWSGPEEEYHEAFRLIDAACDAIIKKYSIPNPDDYRDEYSISK
jgi:protein-tyrosine phosphatase